MSVTPPRRRYYMLASEVEPGWWDLNMVNPAPSANSSTAVAVGANPRCTFLKFTPGGFVTEPSDYDGVGQIDSIIMPTEDDAAYDLLVVGHHLFVLTYRLLRIDIETFTLDGTLDMGFLLGEARRLAYDGMYLYVVGWKDRGRLFRINPETLAIVDYVIFNPGEIYTSDVVIEGDYVYVAFQSPNAKIVKLDRSSLTRVGEIRPPITSPDVMSLAVSGGYLYAVIRFYPIMVGKIDLSTFSLVGMLALPEDPMGGDDLDVMGEYLFGSLRSPNGGVFRVHLPDFSYAGRTTISPDLGPSHRIGVFKGHVYAGLGAERGGVARIDPYTLEVLNIIPTFVDHGITGTNTTGLVYAVGASNSHLYAGLRTFPRVVVKISVSTPAGWRTRCLVGGKFSAGDWVFSLKLRNPSPYAMTVRPMLRLYRRHPQASAPGEVLADVMAPNPVTILPDSVVTVQFSSALPALDFGLHSISLEVKLHVRESTPDPMAVCTLVVNEVGSDASWVETPPLTLTPPTP